ncbi:MAG: hypothetical protein LHW57_06725, partial [Candidatus Cloacimonetes bacterium]|nr:hypothetical protein [Candidatus Cloacimonadota bacterium]
MKKALFILVLCFAGWLVATPNHWTGAADTNWHNDANWSFGHVPTASEDATVLAVYASNSPSVDADAACLDLTVGTGFSVSVNSGTLTVNDRLYQYGTLTLAGSAALAVREAWLYGGSLLSSGPACLLELKQDLLVQAGAAIDFPGYFLINGIYSSTLDFQSAATFGSLYLLKSSGSVTLSVDSAAPVTAANGIYVDAGNTFINNYAGSIICGGNLQIEAGGSCLFNSGTLVMYG